MPSRRQARSKHLACVVACRTRVAPGCTAPSMPWRAFAKEEKARNTMPNCAKEMAASSTSAGGTSSSVTGSISNSTPMATRSVPACSRCASSSPSRQLIAIVPLPPEHHLEKFGSERQCISQSKGKTCRVSNRSKVRSRTLDGLRDETIELVGPVEAMARVQDGTASVGNVDGRGTQAVALKRDRRSHSLVGYETHGFPVQTRSSEGPHETESNYGLCPVEKTELSPHEYG